MAVPYTFGSATSSIPLSQLDSNFATGITLGNTTVYLGNTTTSFGNVTLTNVTISSVSTAITPSQGGTGLVTIPANNVILGNGTSNVTVVAPGTSGNVLTSNGTTWSSSTISAASVSAAGSTTQVQYNNGGAFAGSANLTFNGTTLTAAGLSGPFNGSVGATTPSTGAFTTLSASSTVSGTGFSTYLASPPAIGGTAAAAGSFTTLSASSDLTLSGGTANGVTYLNGSKVLTSGSALTFDGQNLGVDAASAYGTSYITLTARSRFGYDGNNVVVSDAGTGKDITFLTGGSERMRLTSTGLGIGTSSPLGKLDVRGTAYFNGTGATGGASQLIAAFAASGGSNFGQLINTNTTWSLGYGTSYSSVGTSVLTWDASGNVGIGTSSPSFKLQVEGAANSAALTLLRLNNSGTTSGGPGIASRISFTAGSTALGYIQGSNFASGAGGLQFSGDGTNAQATLDSSGNLGLGVTPSAWGGSSKILQISNAAFRGAGNSAYVGANYYFDGSNNRYIASAAASLYEQDAGRHIFYTAASGTAGNAISFTQAMTLDASGNLAVGTTTNKVTQFGGSATGMTIGSATYPVLSLWDTADASYNFMLAQDGGTAYVFNNANGPLTFSTNATERARIDSSGNLLLGTTSALQSGEKFAVLDSVGTAAIFGKQTFGASGWVYKCWNNATSGDNSFIEFQTETTITARGSITYNRAGGLTAYNTTSDYRAKDISGPVTNSGALIDSVPVYMGKMKGATQERPMFIAHETPAYAHTGEKDAVDADGNPVYQQMDASALIPVMWAEIQSLRQRLAAANL